jgi:C-terminal processing protease CtpA/Prc
MHRWSVLLTLLVFMLPASAEDAAPTAQQELSAAIDVLKTHHLNRDSMDWNSIEAQALARLKEEKAASDAYPAIRYVIAELGVRHTFLITADGFKAMTTGQKVGATSPPKPNMPDARLAASGVALIHIPWFQGDEMMDRAYVASARTALNGYEVQGICRYIIDLRGNSGGSMFPMLNGVKSLLGNTPFGYWDNGQSTAFAWEISNAPTQWQAGQPLADYAEAVAPIRHARIAVLIDRKTSSSGEFTAIAFEGMRNVRVFGEPSGGYVTANAPFALPDGARLMVSTGWATDRSKRPYRVAVVPDEHAAPGQPTVDTAILWLKKQRCR